jgi:hypothetical protein
MAFTIWELLFWGFLQALVVALVVTRVSKHAKLVGPLVMWRSKAGLAWVNHVSRTWRGWWRAYGDLGIILAFGFAGAWYVFRKQKTAKRVLFSLLAPLFLLSPYISAIITGSGVQGLFAMAQAPILFLYFGGYSLSLTALLTQEAIKVVSGYLIGVPVAAAVAPALPGIEVQGSPFSIPWYGWLAFPILIAVHELSHGILARVEGFRVKATGVVLFGLFPFGAFVEPDEKQLQKGAPHKQLRVYSVGSTANYLTAFLLLAAVMLVVTPALDAANFVGVYSSYYDSPQVVSLLATSSFAGKLLPGDKILSINGTSTQSIADVHNRTAQLGASAYASVETQRGAFGGTLDANAKLGISSLKDTFLPMPWQLTLLVDFIGFLGVVVFFNFVVGVMNLLPMFPLDGGMMFGVLLGTWIGKKRGFAWARWLAIYVLFLLAVNIFPLFFPNS